MTKPFSVPRTPAGACKFGWTYWNALYQEFQSSGWWSEERWQLASLHSRLSLDALAEQLALAYRASGIFAKVWTQSIWIDGTPQVVGFLPSGARLAQCELADLLFIVNQLDASGKLVKRTGVLMQGKTVKRHGALPSNHSSKKERLLLEGLDRSRPLSVYKDIQLTNHVGDYTFGGLTGLKDCARYLMMPKKANWCPGCAPLKPLQVGWPRSRSTSSIAPTTDFVSAMQGLAIGGTIGRDINDKSNLGGCEWSRLVWSLLGGYQLQQMSGYGGHPRVNSSGVVSFMTNLGANDTIYDDLPPRASDEARLPLEEGPAISVLQLTIEADLPRVD